MLEINNLTIKFKSKMGEITVVDNLNLNIKKGDKIGIIGESGSGKTSLALSIMGLCEGEVIGSVKYKGEELLEKDDSGWNEIRGKKISMVFQNTGEVLNPVYTLIDQVMEPYLEIHPNRKGEAYDRAAYLLKKVGLGEEQFYSYPFYLSGGEVQRGMIAMALMNDPEFIILDEPTSALDVNTGAELISFFNDLAGDKTVLVISHDLSTVAKLTDITTVLYAGRKLESAPTSSLLKDPIHPYTRALIRSYPTGDTTKDLQGIRGEISSRSNTMAGCPFHNRCTQSLDICESKRPSMAKRENHDFWHLSCHRGGVVTLLYGKGLTKTYLREKNKNSKKTEKETMYFNAVDDVDIEIKEGEIMTLVGESGSGKTTLGHILAGMNEPTNGKVYFEKNTQHKELYSTKEHEKKEIRQDLQLLFQNPHKAVSHRLMVQDIIEEPLKIQGYKDQQERLDKVKKALNLVSLPYDSYFTHKYPHELSGGELQRVTIARALVLRPKVLIADEPSASLDASVQAKVLKLLMHLQNEEGFSLLLITHDIALAKKVGDRIAVMHSGRILETGSTSLTFNSPLHPYTKNLLQLAPNLDQDNGRYKRPKQLNLNAIANEGCTYFPYCENAKEICYLEKPRLESLGFRKAACHLID